MMLTSSNKLHPTSPLRIASSPQISEVAKAAMAARDSAFAAEHAYPLRPACRTRASGQCLTG
jgi:hypothetical protein